MKKRLRKKFNLKTENKELKKRVFILEAEKDILIAAVERHDHQLSDIQERIARNTKACNRNFDDLKFKLSSIESLCYRKPVKNSWAEFFKH